MKKRILFIAVLVFVGVSSAEPVLEPCGVVAVPGVPEAKSAAKTLAHKLLSLEQDGELDSALELKLDAIINRAGF